MRSLFYTNWSMMGEVIRVSGRAPDVGEFFKEAMLSQKFADVALCCPGGQRFLAHRLVLSAASPYLQEVLLAHSRTSSHCEPITVILAEVEAPELAALLGFVYTGSATVPRPRLNAFLHAAEALHIRLPPVPLVMTCSPADCKQEDTKDVKISPGCLECDRCRRPRRNLDADSAGKEEPYPSAESLEAAREIGPLPESMNFAGSRYAASRYRSATWPAPPFASAGLEKAVHGVDRLLDKAGTDQMDVGRYRAVHSRIDRICDRVGGYAESVVAGCDSSINGGQQEFCESRRSAYDLHGQLDPLESRMRAGERRLGVNEEHSVRKDLVITENSFEEDRASWIDTCQSRAISPQLPDRRPYEKSDHGWDLSCGEACFSWKTPKRHVANRVIASPWRQTIRPYHLPKLQPIVLQPHSDDIEIGENLRPPEVARPPAILASPDRRSSKNIAAIDHYYGVEVPISPEMTYGNGPRSLEPGSVPVARHHDYYSPQVSFATTAQAISSMSSEVRSIEVNLQPQNNVISTTTRLPSCDAVPSNANGKASYLGQVLAHPPQRSEISHPVSRLCDTIESSDKSDRFACLDAERAEKEPRKEEKLAERVIINSDNNNNDAIVGHDVPQRGGPSGAQEDHRCDQCGKTFVTKASLKV